MKPPRNIRKKTAAFFLLFLLSIHLHAIEPVLTISPDNPIMDNSGESGTASFQLDVSPETKSSLKGTGQIAVDLSANQFTTQLIGPKRVYIHYINGKTTPVTVNFRKAPWMPNPANEFEDKSLPSHKKAKNECLVWIILISSGSVGLDFLKWFKNFNTCLLVIS